MSDDQTVLDGVEESEADRGPGAGEDRLVGPAGESIRRSRDRRRATAAAVDSVTLGRGDVATNQRDVIVPIPEAQMMVADVAAAMTDAGLDPTRHDPNWFPVMVRTEVANRLLKAVVDLRTGPDDPLLPSHVAILAMTVFAGKLESRDPEFLAMTDRLREQIRGSSWWRPAQARVPEVRLARPPVPGDVDPLAVLRNQVELAPRRLRTTRAERRASEKARGR